MAGNAVSRGKRVRRNESTLLGSMALNAAVHSGCRIAGIGSSGRQGYDEQGKQQRQATQHRRITLAERRSPGSCVMSSTPLVRLPLQQFRSEFEE